MSKYSVLIAGTPWGKATEKKVWDYLREGRKVLWFTAPEMTDSLGKDEKFKGFYESKARFFQIYFNRGDYQLIIEDGADLKGEVCVKGEKPDLVEVDDVLRLLEYNDPSFNLEQYKIEHFERTSDIIISAGAGTGKTHVMIDRIMYLLHMDDDFDLSQLAMITFTRKSTDEMRHRLMETLEDKYRLTGKTMYLECLEDVASANISTIHSFFRQILQEVGAILGYGTDFRLRSFAQEREAILHRLLEGYYKEKRAKGKPEWTVNWLIGLVPHEVLTLAKEFWKHLENRGYSDEEIKGFNWGEADKRSKYLQDSLIALLSKVEEEYEKEKVAGNAIAVQDLIHELDKAKRKQPLQNHIISRYRYLFCDEFQDTDNVQIETIVELNRIFNSHLFVVGDIKQSIYRFRGATSSAFMYLWDQLNQQEKENIKSMSLTKNYRTSKDILDKLHVIFSRWGNIEPRLIQYDIGLTPQVMKPGYYEPQMAYCPSNRYKCKTECGRKGWFINTVKKIRSEIYRDIKVKEAKEGGEDKLPENRVVCLTRTNQQLSVVSYWCEKIGIPCRIRKKGEFYRSDAVLDFCAMVEGCLYEQEPMYLYNRSLSAYVGMEPDYMELESINGDPVRIRKYMNESLGGAVQDAWKRYHDQFMNRPVMAVLREIVAEMNPVERYVMIRKKVLKDRLTGDALKTQVFIDARQYEADLNKLISILTERFSGDFVSLLDICNHLRVMIETDDQEDQAIPEQLEAEAFHVDGMTVHGAKGLEFDNVLLPFMCTPFEDTSHPEILVSEDKKDVGWIYRTSDEKYSRNNANYDLLYSKELRDIKEEEARLLYVAMTRARYRLSCYDSAEKSNLLDAMRWSDLI